jgi:hypothetical protein
MNKNQAAWLIVRSSGFICAVFGILKIVETLTIYCVLLSLFSSPNLSPQSPASLGQLIGLVPGILLLAAGIYLLKRGRFVVNLVIREE